MGAEWCPQQCCYNRWKVCQASRCDNKEANCHSRHTYDCVPLTTNKEGGSIVGSQIQAFLIVAADHRHKIHLGITEEIQNPESLKKH